MTNGHYKHSEKAKEKCVYIEYTKRGMKLTPSSSKWTLSTLRPAGRDTVKKYALEPNEFESDQSNAFANDRPRTSKL